MHKSQGVGSPPRRGVRKEYFKLLDGPPMKDALLDGIDTTWARVPDSENVAEKIKAPICVFSPGGPAASVPKLLEIRKELGARRTNRGCAKPAKSTASSQRVWDPHSRGRRKSRLFRPPERCRSNLKRSIARRCRCDCRGTNSDFRPGLRIDVALAQDELVAKDLRPVPERRDFDSAVLASQAAGDGHLRGGRPAADRPARKPAGVSH